MNTNNGLPLVAPRVTPILDPGFRPAVLAMRGFRDLVDELQGVRYRCELLSSKPTARSLPSERVSCPSRIRRRRPTFRFSSGSSNSSSGRAVVGASMSMARRPWRPALPHTTARRRRAGSMRIWWANGCSIIRWRSCTQSICRPSTRRRGRLGVISRDAASVSIWAAAIVRWPRSSTARWSSAMRRSGIPTTSRIRSITSTESWTR